MSRPKRGTGSVLTATPPWQGSVRDAQPGEERPDPHLPAVAYMLMFVLLLLLLLLLIIIIMIITMIMIITIIRLILLVLLLSWHFIVSLLLLSSLLSLSGPGEERLDPHLPAVAYMLMLYYCC